MLDDWVFMHDSRAEFVPESRTRVSNTYVVNLLSQFVDFSTMISRHCMLLRKLQKQLLDCHWNVISNKRTLMQHSVSKSEVFAHSFKITTFITHFLLHSIPELLCFDLQSLPLAILFRPEIVLDCSYFYKESFYIHSRTRISSFNIILKEY